MKGETRNQKARLCTVVLSRCKKSAPQGQFVILRLPQPLSERSERVRRRTAKDLELHCLCHRRCQIALLEAGAQIEFVVDLQDGRGWEPAR